MDPEVVRVRELTGYRLSFAQRCSLRHILNQWHHLAERKTQIRQYRELAADIYIRNCRKYVILWHRVTTCLREKQSIVANQHDRFIVESSFQWWLKLFLSQVIERAIHLRVIRRYFDQWRLKFFKSSLRLVGDQRWRQTVVSFWREWAVLQHHHKSKLAVIRRNGPLAHSFTLWRIALRLRLCYRLTVRQRLRAYFWRWCQAQGLTSGLRRFEQIFCKLQLKRTLKDLRLEAQTHRQKYRRVSASHRKRLLRNTLLCWRDSLDRCRRLAARGYLLSVVRSTRPHHLRLVMQDETWKHGKLQQAVWSRMIHSNEARVARLFHEWHTETRRVKLTKHKEAALRSRFLERLRREIFSAWVRGINVRRVGRRLLWRLAAEHCRAHIRGWRELTLRVLSLGGLEERLENYHLCRVMGKAFDRWRSCLATTDAYRALRDNLIAKRQVRQMQRIMRAWRVWAAWNRSLKSKSDLLTARCRRRVLRATLVQWGLSYAYRRRSLRRVRKLVALKIEIDKRVLLQTWRQRSRKWGRIENTGNEQYDDYLRCVRRRYFRRWLKALDRVQKTESQEANLEATIRVQRTRILFHRWTQLVYYQARLRVKAVALNEAQYTRIAQRALERWLNNYLRLLQQRDGLVKLLARILERPVPKRFPLVSVSEGIFSADSSTEPWSSFAADFPLVQVTTGTNGSLSPPSTTTGSSGEGSAPVLLKLEIYLQGMILFYNRYQELSGHGRDVYEEAIASLQDVVIKYGGTVSIPLGPYLDRVFRHSTRDACLYLGLMIAHMGKLKVYLQRWYGITRRMRPLTQEKEKMVHQRQVRRLFKLWRMLVLRSADDPITLQIQSHRFRRIVMRCFYGWIAAFNSYRLKFERAQTSIHKRVQSLTLAAWRAITTRTAYMNDRAAQVRGLIALRTLKRWHLAVRRKRALFGMHRIVVRQLWNAFQQGVIDLCVHRVGLKMGTVLWTRAVLGPPFAKLKYHTKMRKVFQDWRASVAALWRARAIQVKHGRILLWKSFKIWRRRLRRLTALKSRIENRSLKLRCFAQWKLQVAKVNQTVSKEQQLITLRKRLIFHNWFRQYRLTCRFRILIELRQIKFLLLWHNLARSVGWAREIRLAVDDGRTLVYIRNWKRMVEIRKSLNRKKLAVERLTLHKYWAGWQQLSLRMQGLKAAGAYVSRSRRERNSRRILGHWIQRARMKAWLRVLVTLRQRSITWQYLRLGLDAFKLNLRTFRLRDRLNRLARLVVEPSLLRRQALVRLLTRTMSVDEQVVKWKSKLTPAAQQALLDNLTASVNGLYTQRLSQSIQWWRQEARRLAKRRTLMSLVHTKQMTRCFFTMMRAAQLQLKGKIVGTRQDRILSAEVLSFWRSETKRVSHLKALGALIEHDCDIMRLRNALMTWQVAYNQEVMCNMACAMLQPLVEASQKRAALSAFQYYARLRMYERQLMSKAAMAVSDWTSRHLREVIVLWRDEAFRLRKARLIRLTSDFRHLGLAFRVWYYRWMKALQIQQYIARGRKRWALSLWAAALAHRIRCEGAGYQVELRKLQLYFNAWHGLYAKKRVRFDENALPLSERQRLHFLSRECAARHWTALMRRIYLHMKLSARLRVSQRNDPSPVRADDLFEQLKLATSDSPPTMPYPTGVVPPVETIPIRVDELLSDASSFDFEAMGGARTPSNPLSDLVERRDLFEKHLHSAPPRPLTLAGILSEAPLGDLGEGRKTRSVSRMVEASSSSLDASSLGESDAENFRSVLVSGKRRRSNTLMAPNSPLIGLAETELSGGIHEMEGADSTSSMDADEVYSRIAMRYLKPGRGDMTPAETPRGEDDGFAAEELRRWRATAGSEPPTFGERNI